MTYGKIKAMTSTPAQANERLKAILKAGKLFEGKYRILRPLGAGSFAVVVHARHEVMERDVALKFLKPKVVTTNPEVSERFVKEVQIASRLKHPNVVSIYDFGVTEDGIYYMVQEFVDGVTVDELLPAGRPLQQARVLKMVHQMLDCLSEAHAQGVIHRDLKPSNLMSTRDEEGGEVIKILDFGVAKLLEPKASNVPTSQVRQSTKFIGTPIYMSPEQILGREVSPASDLYSVGLMCYEMCTGQPPIKAEQIAEVVQQHLSDAPFDFPMLHLLPSHVQRAIIKATSRDPGERFQSAQQFARALSGEDGGHDELVVKTPHAAPPSGARRAPSGRDVVAPAVSAEAPQAERDERDELAAFLGHNYIAPDEGGHLGDTFAPLPRQVQRARRASSSEAFSLDDILSPSSPPPPQHPPRPGERAERSPRHPRSPGGLERRGPEADLAPSGSGVHRARPESASVLTSQSLELDMEAMRSVRHQRERHRTDERQRVREEYKLQKLEERSGSALWGAVLVALGAISAGVMCVMLSAVSDGMPGVARVFLGVLPVLVALAMVAFKSGRTGGTMQRWLEPVALRLVILLPVLCLGVALMWTDQASIALRHEGAWLFHAAPESAPFTWFASAAQAVAEMLAVLFDALAKIIPW